MDNFFFPINWVRWNPQTQFLNLIYVVGICFFLLMLLNNVYFLHAKEYMLLLKIGLEEFFKTQF